MDNKVNSNIDGKQYLSPDQLMIYKIKLKQLLKKHFGDTSRPEVIEAINELA